MALLDTAIRPDPQAVGDAQGWRTGRGDWLPTAQGRTEIKLDPDEMAYFWLRAEVDLAIAPADLELVLDSQDYGQVYVNGFAVSGGHAVTLWDEGNWALPIKDYVLRGRNVIVLRCRPSKYYAERVAGRIIDPYDIEPLVLQGSFAAFAQADGCYLVAPEIGEVRLGAWEGQGYPAFSGTGEYRRRFELSDLTGRAWLVLDDVRQVAEVIVNGERVGVQPWAPYEFEITRFLRTRQDDLVVRVTGNLGNLFRQSYTGLISHPVLSGLVGKARLVRVP